MNEDEEISCFKHDLEIRFERDLARFCGVCEKSAQNALGRLAVPSRRYVHTILSYDLSRDDKEEIVQTVLMKAWQNRSAFKNQGRGAWFAWLRRIARNAYVDCIRARRSDVPIGGMIGEEGEEPPLIERCITNALGKECFYLADVCLLGLDASLTPEEQNRRLLAAQYYYLDDWSMEEVLEMLADTHPESPRISHAQLGSWLEDPGILRYLIYRELCYSPERLTSHLLGLPEATTSGDLDSVLARLRATDSLEGPNGWNALEAQMILWHYFRGVGVDEVKDVMQNRVETAMCQAVFVRCNQAFPFVRQMRRVGAMVDALDFLGSGRHRLLNGESGIWYRLVFEYRYRYNLPHRDIQERVYAAAHLAHYPITLDMLNTWLSGGRLLNRLRLCLKNRDGDQYHG